MPVRRTTEVTSPITTSSQATTTVSPKTPSIFFTTNRSRTTRIVRKRVTGIVAANRRIASTTSTPIATTSSTTTTTSTTEIVPFFSNDLDYDVASVFSALTSVRPRKTQIVNINSATRSLKTVTAAPLINETSSLKTPPTTTFDKILEHQYKIKGLDKDYQEEKVEDEEKLIGVLGSQVSSNYFTSF